ncbi:LysR family transcriptional regulator [Flocculibacter collagenilyticus]|uniref:LysR family transcriptional regulator n=1 Tax=Flocculibacter collagenilyticus TaxID=2744479 RepID=UPI0018F67310|nr:LysR family transcriptional regulator [Flocculibacter collagenilyticus]
MDKLRGLKYFKRVAELGSFTLAANEFDVPASSISRRVRDLETLIGVELLQRSTRQVHLTELGQRYYSMICEGIQRLDEADVMISQQLEAPAGVISISCMPTYGEKRLTPILLEFNKLYPKIIFDLHYSDELISLGQDPVDIAIRGGFAPDEHLIAKRLSNNEFILVSSPQYLATLGTDALPLSKAQLLQVNTLQYRAPSGIIDWYMNELDWQKLPLAPSLISNNGSVFEQALINGRGIACVPKWSVANYLASGELVNVPTEFPVSVSPGGDVGVFMLFLKSKYQITKVKLCIDYIYTQLCDIELQQTIKN